MQEMRVWSLDWEDPRRRKWQPTPLFLPGKHHGQKSLVGYSPWGCRAGHNLATKQQQTDPQPLPVKLNLHTQRLKQKKPKCWTLNPYFHNIAGHSIFKTLLLSTKIDEWLLKFTERILKSSRLNPQSKVVIKYLINNKFRTLQTFKM